MFRCPKEKWRCVGTQFSRPRQSGDLFFVFFNFYLIYIKEKKVSVSANKLNFALAIPLNLFYKNPDEM